MTWQKSLARWTIWRIDFSVTDFWEYFLERLTGVAAQFVPCRLDLTFALTHKGHVSEEHDPYVSIQRRGTQECFEHTAFATMNIVVDARAPRRASVAVFVYPERISEHDYNEITPIRQRSNR